MKKIAISHPKAHDTTLLDQTIKILEAISQRFNIKLKYQIDRIESQDQLMDLMAREKDACDALLYHAAINQYFEGPSFNLNFRKLKSTLGLFSWAKTAKAYSNFIDASPIKTSHFNAFDFIIFNELSKDAYDEIDQQPGLLQSNQKQFITQSFKAAARRKQRFTFVGNHHQNETFLFWKALINSIHPSFPQVKVDYIDTADIPLQLMQHPQLFDVLVIPHPFGSVITEQAQKITGIPEMQSLACFGNNIGLFAPNPNQNGSVSNPIAMIHALIMMFHYLEMPKAAQVLNEAIIMCLQEGIGTVGLEQAINFTRSQWGDLIASIISEENPYFRKDKMMESQSTII